MNQIADWPYVALSFDASGNRLGSGPIRPAGITDLLVISHGWHTLAKSALNLYTTLLLHVREILPPDPARKVGVTGIFWPADEFNDDLSRETASPNAGAAALGGGGDLPLDHMLARAKAVASFLGDSPEAMAAAAVHAQAGSDDADAFINRLRSLIQPAAVTDPQVLQDHKALLSSMPGRTLIDAWSKPFPIAPGGGGGGVAALGDGDNPISKLFFGVRSAIVSALNTAAYFEMKKRSGVIGPALGRLLDVDGLDGVRLHLIGHSFGARLVTATADTMSDVRAQSLTLLQGAFSHNAFGKDVPGVGDGFYRGVIAHERVAGPICVTHTWNDTAVGFWYPLASRVSNDVSEGLVITTPEFGGPQDLHGGMGANGALLLGAGEGSEAIYDGVSALTVRARKVNSLTCDAFVHEHTDVDNIGCGRIVAAAMS